MMRRFLVAAACLAAPVMQLSAGTVEPDPVTFVLTENGTVTNLDTQISDTATSGTFAIFAQTPVLIAGVSLDLSWSGDSIEVTSVELPSNAEIGSPRWTINLNGTVDGTNNVVEAIEGGAFIGLGSNGMGPTTAGVDNLYNSVSDAFLFARVNYDVVQLGSTDLSLSVGRNIIGFNDPNDAINTPIHLGVGDLAANTAGSTGTMIDGLINVVQTTVEVPPGMDVMESVGGGTGVTGGVDAMIENVVMSGELTSDFNNTPIQAVPPELFEELEAADYNLVSDSLQIWDIDFTGELAGAIELTLAYSDQNLTVAESDLNIFHKGDDGLFRILPKLAQDLVANTITVETPSLSPFVLGVDSSALIPEPSSLLLIVLGLMPLWATRRTR